ncbi:MAG: hypothetical protein ACLUOI_30955 [Eisenbergiella sp.]
MKSCENFVSDKSQYFIYSPSKTARDIFLYPCSAAVSFMSQVIIFAGTPTIISF